MLGFAGYEAIHMIRKGQACCSAVGAKVARCGGCGITRRPLNSGVFDQRPAHLANLKTEHLRLLNGAFVRRDHTAVSRDVERVVSPGARPNAHAVAPTAPCLGPATVVRAPTASRRNTVCSGWVAM